MTEGHQCNRCDKFFAGDLWTEVENRKTYEGTRIKMRPMRVGYPSNKTYCISCSTKLMHLLDRFDKGEFD